MYTVKTSRKLVRFIESALIMATLSFMSSIASAAQGGYAKQLPEFSLEDPAGVIRSEESFIGNVAVFIVTIPNVKHGEFQGRWNRFLTREDRWPQSGPNLVFLEDMSQTEFRDMAIEKMREKYRSGKQPILLLDNDGNVRRRFRITNDETVLLIFDKNGALVKAYDGKPTIENAREVRALIETLR